MTLVVTAVLAAAAAALVTALVFRTLVQRSAADVGRTDQQVRDTFQALAAEALHANRAAFLDLAGTTFASLQKEAAGDLATRQRAIDELVKPMAATLKEVDQRLARPSGSARVPTRG